LSRRDVRARFDQIVAFSGVERFLDTPLKRYSAGMRLRLAFAVAAHLEPDVLVIDEALAVGDAEFQRRCLGRMEDLQRSGRTVVFVSHDLGAVGRLCERTLWLDQGRVRFDGPTHEALRRYFEAVGRIDAGRVELETDPHLPVALTSVWLTSEDGVPITGPTRLDTVVLRLRLQVRERIPGLDVGFYIADSMGLRVLEDMLRIAEPASGLGSSPGEAEIAVALPGVLRADDYLVGIYVYSGHDYYVVEEPLRFRVAPAPGESEDGLRPAVRPQLRWSVTGVER
jgi:ABC-2 type transport system ATP-binding protein/lipopolysaccharide transport system ATP-binding protein